MKRFFSRLHRPLRNERGEITFFACFFVVGVVMLISFLLLYASVRITCINIRNGAKMELNNLSATIYADTYRSQRETNFEEYLRTLYSSRDYTEMLEATVAGALPKRSLSLPMTTQFPTSALNSMWWVIVWSTSFTVMLTFMCGCLDIVILPSPSG